MAHVVVWSLILSSLALVCVGAYLAKVARNLMRAGFDNIARDTRTVALAVIACALGGLCLALLCMHVTGIR